MNAIKIETNLNFSNKKIEYLQYIKNLKNLPLGGIVPLENGKTSQMVQNRWNFFQEMQKPNFIMSLENEKKYKEYSYYLKYWMLIFNKNDLYEKYNNLILQDFGYGNSVYTVHLVPNIHMQTRDTPRISLLMLACIMKNEKMLEYFFKNESSYLSASDECDFHLLDFCLNYKDNFWQIENTDLYFQCVKNLGFINPKLEEIELFCEVLQKADNSPNKMEVLELIKTNEYPFKVDDKIKSICEKIKIYNSVHIPNLKNIKPKL